MDGRFQEREQQGHQIPGPRQGFSEKISRCGRLTEHAHQMLPTKQWPRTRANLVQKDEGHWCLFIMSFCSENDCFVGPLLAVQQGDALL